MKERVWVDGRESLSQLSRLGQSQLDSIVYLISFIFQLISYNKRFVSEYKPNMKESEREKDQKRGKCSICRLLRFKIPNNVPPVITY